MKFKANLKKAPLAPLILIKYLNLEIPIEWGNETILFLDDDKVFSSEEFAFRYFCNKAAEKQIYGTNLLQKCEVDSWITFSLGPLLCEKNYRESLNYLDTTLSSVNYLVGNILTAADIAVWTKLAANRNWNGTMDEGKVPRNVHRWFSLVGNLQIFKDVLNSLPAEATIVHKKCESVFAARKEEGKFVELPGAENEKVIVRFPPEASGYLHIGHAKAALLNQYYRDAFKGKLIMRFDDTNPAKEKVDFEKVILEDLELLEIGYDIFSHTSDYFDLLLDKCELLLRSGKAYVDDTDPEIMKQEREKKLESKNRNNSIERNMAMWTEMKAGSEKGQKFCVRAKIDMQSLNGCMRDPTIYRCKNEPHPKTGLKYKVYPTYDFACPIVDSVEGVTHSLRTMEYHDRDEQFYWFIDILGLRKPYIWEYSRLNMTNTVLSKRKLTWFVEKGYVDGWDDPRMPTVRGILRRGMTVEGLKQFITAQGSSRSVVVMEWDKIWAINKKVIDPVAPRYTAVDAYHKVPVVIEGVSEQETKCLLHPKNPDIGEKTIWLTPKIWIDEADALLVKEGENVTLINWGNVTIKSVMRNNDKIYEIRAIPNFEDKNYKKTLKLTWLPDSPRAKCVECICVYYDFLISKPILGKDEDFKNYVSHNTKTEVRMIGDPELANARKSDIIQLQRKGFFICDVPYKGPSIHTGREMPIVLFFIPDGHLKEMPTAASSVLKERNIGEQHMKVQSLKQEKADNKLIDKTKNDEGSIEPKESKVIENPDLLNKQIIIQGNKVRDLKKQKCEKPMISEEIDRLLKLKGKFKSVTGLDWKPDLDLTKFCSYVEELETEKLLVQNTPDSNSVSTKIFEKLKQIKEKGDYIRELKSLKAKKNVVEAEVKTLLELKNEYKSLSGKDWTPDAIKDVEDKSNTSKISTAIVIDTNSQNDYNALELQIKTQGDVVRNLKTSGAEKEAISEALQKLLNLKAEYKTVTGKEYVSENQGQRKISKPKKEKSEQTNSQQNTKKKKANTEKESSVKKVTRLGIEALKEENLPDWYSQVIVKGELIEYYDVSGCYILRPWSFAIWEILREFFDKEIKLLGVKNCYFPIFVSRSLLEKEKSHIADFSPEVAWVTKSGDSDLAEHLAIRPTSETVMYAAYAKWIQSYRDLPIKLNQWNNVVRWEFKHPQPFLRSREFLWQEGHTAYADSDEAEQEVIHILELYARIYTELLAIPVVKGRKTEKEKFAGGSYTLTVEAYVAASGRAIQGATSHHLGQNFSKMFDITFEDPETQEKKFVYQNSWGFTTRTIGVMIMVHADNQGLVLPPRVASIQVIIVPCGITASLSENEKEKLMKTCRNIEIELKESGVRAEGDYRDNYSPGWKFNHWELKGVPVRVEVGPKDLQANQIVTVRRDTGARTLMPMSSMVNSMQSLLENIQESMLKKSTEELKAHKIVCKKWDEFLRSLENKCLILSPYCGEIKCEDEIKESTRADKDVDTNAPSMGAKGLCIPFEQPEPGILESDKCINPKCSNKPKFYTLFGRSY